MNVDVILRWILKNGYDLADNSCKITVKYFSIQGETVFLTEQPPSFILQILIEEYLLRAKPLRINIPSSSASQS